MRPPLRARPAALALGAAALCAAAAARADSVPLALAEGQVVTLQFDRGVDQVAVMDLEVVAVRAFPSRVEVKGLRGGRTQLEVRFQGGAAAAYDVQVAGARRPRGAAAPAADDALEVRVGEDRRLPAGAAERLLLEENGVARVRVDHGAIVVTGVAPGRTSLVLVDAAGARTTYPIRVR